MDLYSIEKDVIVVVHFSIEADLFISIGEVFIVIDLCRTNEDLNDVNIYSIEEDLYEVDLYATIEDVK